MNAPLTLREQAIFTANALRNIATLPVMLAETRERLFEHADNLMRAASQPESVPAASGSHQPCEDDSMSAHDRLFHVREWLNGKLQSGPVETMGYSDRNGHPHLWTAVLFADWDVKQRLAEIDQALQRGAAATRRDPLQGKP